MRVYCTLTDQRYLAKMLAMLRSLQCQSSEDFRLYCLALDGPTGTFLSSQHPLAVWAKDAGLRVVPPYDILKGMRKATYDARPIPYRYYMCAPLMLEYALFKRQADRATYLDADLMFFRDPRWCFDEMADADVAIVPHRFPDHDFERLRPNGLYNVSWVTVSDDPRAIYCLERWRDQVLDRCDASTCGDQRYLDEWPELLPGRLHRFQSIGIGAGPWNTYTYAVTPGPLLNGQPLVFYHMHETQRLPGGTLRLTGYPVTDAQRRLIYDPYETLLSQMEKTLEATECFESTT